MAATESVNVNLESGARHESGHMVIAAVEGLKLKPEGLMVDPAGWGLACYHDAPDDSDSSRERNIIAVLAGFAVEKRFREERSYPARNYLDITWNDDNRKARALLGSLSGNYALNESRLRDQLDHLVETYCLLIDLLACALLGMDWEPIKPLKSGGKWSDSSETMAKYVSGEGAVRILAQQGITAICDAEG